jgi:hypothetical protein
MVRHWSMWGPTPARAPGAADIRSRARSAERCAAVIATTLAIARGCKIERPTYG